MLFTNISALQEAQACALSAAAAKASRILFTDQPAAAFPTH